MNTQNTLKVALLAGTCLLPLMAAAQDEDPKNNEIDLAIQGQTAKSPVFARYNGFNDNGATLLGGFDLRGGDAWDSGSANFWRLQGHDLDANSKDVGPEANLSAQAGVQGLWVVNTFYNAITYTGQDFYSAFTSPANGTLGLQPGFTPFGGATATKAGTITAVNSTGAASAINPTGKLALEQAGTRRDQVGADARIIYGSWTFSTGLKHEHKSGSLEQTMDQSTSGLAFLQPVDYDTDRFFVQAAYSSRDLQAVLAYNLSEFRDFLSSVQAPFFVSETASQTHEPTLYQATSSYSTPPSNVAHYFNGSVGYNLTDTTRLMANGRVGFEMQNASLAPASVVPWTPGSPYANDLAANPSNGGLGARLYGGNVTATSQPISQGSVRVSYSLDARDAGYNDIIAGAANGTGTAAPSVISVNNHALGQQWTSQKAVVEAAYRILSNTKVTISYTLDRMDRDLSEVTHSATNTFAAKLSSSPLKDLTASISYEHSERNGSVQYMLIPTVSTATTSPNIISIVSTDYGISSVAVPWYQAAMSGDTLKLRSDYQIDSTIGVGLNGKLAIHDYHYPVGLIGENRDYTGTIGPDVSYSPTKSVTAHFFYTYEEIYHGDQASSAAYSVNGDYGASVATTNGIHTVGLSGDWKPCDHLKLKSSYTLAYGNINYDMFDGLTTANTGWTTSPEVNLQNPPRVTSSMHTVNVGGEYELSSNITWAVGYSYNMFKDNDWAYSTYAAVFATSTTGGLQVSSGETAPSYRVQTIYTGVRYKF